MKINTEFRSDFFETSWKNSWYIFPKCRPTMWFSMKTEQSCVRNIIKNMKFRLVVSFNYRAFLLITKNSTSEVHLSNIMYYLRVWERKNMTTWFHSRKSPLRGNFITFIVPRCFFSFCKLFFLLFLIFRIIHGVFSLPRNYTRWNIWRCVFTSSI